MVLAVEPAFGVIFDFLEDLTAIVLFRHSSIPWFFAFIKSCCCFLGQLSSKGISQTPLLCTTLLCTTGECCCFKTSYNLTGSW